MKDNYVFSNLPLRYNIYKERMEFEKDNTPYYIVDPSKIATIKIGDKVYTHVAYIHNNKIHTTYFILS